VTNQTTTLENTPNSATCTLQQMNLRDGVTVNFRHWPATQASRKAIYLFHRGHEHSGRFEDVIPLWRTLDPRLNDYHFYCWDMRGHGALGKEQGSASSVAQLTADADEFVRFTSSQHDIDVSESFAIAHSIGGVVAAAWIHDYAPKIRALVLLTPAFKVRLYVPLAVPGLRLLKLVKKDAKVTSYVKPTMLTHDAMQAERYRVDAMISPDVSVNLLLDLHDTSKRLIQDAGAINVPSLVISAGSDWVVDNATIERYFDGLSSSTKQYVCSTDKYHDLLHEVDREATLKQISEFLFCSEVQHSSGTSLLSAHQRSHSAFRYQQLKRSLSWWHPKRWYYLATRFTLGSIGRLSDGIGLGWETGFNSGATLDHVYKNESSGKLGLGKLIDRVYLNAPGWKGIRTRRTHMNEVLDSAIDSVLQTKPSIRISDVACGAGRYVLDAIDRWKDKDVSSTLCDFSPVSIDRAKANAQQMKIDRVRFAQSDAFNEESIQHNVGQTDIAIVSGLLELFSDNELALRTLRGLSKCLPIDGYLIYTNQPWHPQQELIARSLHGFDRKLWVMRCRSSQEMDQLVESAGFQKIKMLIDEEGIFTVSLAKRVNQS
jgi:alpha-beta hydrolase superfamily lysophospholipase/SAM-dependent methyltransferase